MCAEDVRRERRVAVLRQLVQRGFELRLGRRDEGRLVGRDAGAQDRLAGPLVSRPIGGEEVDAREAVDLEVDETRRGDASAGTTVDADARDPSVGDVDVAAHERAVDERRLDSKPRHRQPAACSSVTGTSTASIAAPESSSKKWRRCGSIATSTASPGWRRK